MTRGGVSGNQEIPEADRNRLPIRTETVIGRNSGEYDGKPYGGFYTQKQAKEIVEYAAERYITKFLLNRPSRDICKLPLPLILNWDVPVVRTKYGDDGAVLPKTCFVPEMIRY